jgi:hypothetical protein
MQSNFCFRRKYLLTALLACTVGLGACGGGNDGAVSGGLGSSATDTPAAAAESGGQAGPTEGSMAATSTVATGQSIFTTQLPATTNNTDGVAVNYELGMRFSSASAGMITALRFYKASYETGSHTGRIWSPSGTLLGSVVFSTETASGWQTATLATPIRAAANTTYTVTVNTGATYYVATSNGLASKISSGPLSTIVGSNGAYGPVGSYPTQSWQASNYFRDVVFVPDVAAPPPAGLQNLFGTQTPATTNNTDGANVNYELGLRFTASTAGQVNGVRFFKASSESGVHTGKLWSATGALLGSVVFSNETASGWQTAHLATPIQLVAGAVYAVTVNTGASYYVATGNALAAKASSGNLDTVVGSNGIYGPVGAYPTQSWQATNYFRDVVFQPATTSPAPTPTPSPAPTPTPSPTPTPTPTPTPSPTPTPTPTPTPLPATATLSWSAPAAAAVTGYRVYYGTAPGVYLQAPGSGLSIGAATTYTLSGIQRGPAYYFAVTAVDAAGNESPYSNEVMKMIQ